jgi:hypothetical protein
MECEMDKNIENNEEITRQKGAVVFLDALGTKAVWSRNDPLKFIKSELAIIYWTLS